ncbi:MAG: hypothetical protein AAFV88_02495 [Planctomycetota bacterium]
MASSPIGPTSPSPRDSSAFRLSRRASLIALAAGCIGGCRSDSTEQADTKPRSSSVPLRIGVFDPMARAADPSANETSWAATLGAAISRAWSLASEQPVEITPLPLPDAALQSEYDRAAVQDAFAAQALRADVLVLPQTLLGTCVKTQTIIPLPPETRDSFEEDYGRPYASVRNGLGNYGGDTLAVAAGAKAFAFLASDPEAVCQDWASYDQWVAGNEGAAAEPLTPGWAATSFLHRCATSLERNWLLDRRNAQPLLNLPEYESVLEQMKQTCARYQSPAMTPSEIWSAIRLGKLRGGIGYEVPSVEASVVAEADEVFDVTVSDSPATTPASRVWFPTQTLLVCLSSGCRQTDASKQLIGWLSGGEQVESLWRTTASLSPTRKPTAISDTQAGSQSKSTYLRWLETRLDAVQVQTPLSLPAAPLYCDALDARIRQCLEGAKSAKESLQAACEDWEQITESVGRESQIVAWKRSQGFGGGLN